MSLNLRMAKTLKRMGIPLRVYPAQANDALLQAKTVVDDGNVVYAPESTDNSHLAGKYVNGRWVAQKSGEAPESAQFEATEPLVEKGENVLLGDGGKAIKFSAIWLSTSLVAPDTIVERIADGRKFRVDGAVNYNGYSDTLKYLLEVMSSDNRV